MEKKRENILLELDHVSKSFRDGKESREVLKEICMTVAAKEFIAIVGPSGCGKSTLLNIAGMMMSPDQGSVIINGQNMGDIKQRDWTKIRRKHIGFIFQNHHLLPYLTGEEQLCVTGKPDRDSLKELMKELDVYDIRKQYPGKMSGGERQRFAIARAFASEPQIILADEPTASLDSVRGYHVVEKIRDEVHRRNKAAIMVTHDNRVLELCDYVYYMEDGKLFQRN